MRKQGAGHPAVPLQQRGHPQGPLPQETLSPGKAQEVTGPSRAGDLTPPQRRSGDKAADRRGRSEHAQSRVREPGAARVPRPRPRALAGDLRRQPGSPSPVPPSGLGTSHTSSSLFCVRGEKAGSLWRAEGDPDQQTTASSRRRTRGQLPSGRSLLHLARCRPRPGPERCRRPALAEGSAAAPRMVWGAQLAALFAHQALASARWDALGEG